jgi:hypothetical protein
MMQLDALTFHIGGGGGGELRMEMVKKLLATRWKTAIESPIL